MKAREALRKCPVIVGFASAAIALTLVTAIPVGETLEAYCLRELAIALIVVLIAIAMSLNGAKALRPSTVGMGFAFRKSIYIIVVTLIVSIAEFIGLFDKSGMFDVANTPEVAATAVLCLFVGVLEETAFRFLLLGGLLARWGDTKRGIVAATVVSSVAFGAAHLVGSFVGGEFTSFLSILEGLGKLIETGILGLLLATLYIKTRNLTWCILLHAIFDFLAMVPTVLYTGLMASTTYVTSDPEMALKAVIVYIVTCILYMPVIIFSVRMLRRVETPFKGPFRQALEPIKPPKRASKQTSAES